MFQTQVPLVVLSNIGELEVLHFLFGGLILLAKRKGYYTKIKPIVEKLVKKGFRLSGELVEQILKEAGEPR